MKHLINHVVFVLDASGSMRSLSSDIVTIFDGLVAHLARRSQEISQEVRVSVYLFADRTECLFYDMDVMRLPSLKNHYHAKGNTALMDAALLAARELKMTPELHADHAFLMYVLTDGEENASLSRAFELETVINAAAENWTFACLVPNEYGRRQASIHGFPRENIQIWETSQTGLKEAWTKVKVATDNFMDARAKGVRGSKNLFQLDTLSLSKKAVTSALNKLSLTAYSLLPITKAEAIKEFVERWTATPYRPGSGYYILTKPEKIQGYKQICIQDKMTGAVYSGSEARQMLGLPDFEVKVTPAQHYKFNIFAQSTSLNRKLVPGTVLLLMKS